MRKHVLRYGLTLIGLAATIAVLGQARADSALATQLIAERGANAFERTSQFTFERYTEDLLSAIRGRAAEPIDAVSLAS